MAIHLITEYSVCLLIRMNIELKLHSVWTMDEIIMCNVEGVAWRGELPRLSEAF